MHVAWSKSAAVAPIIRDGVVLAADSVGWIDGRVIGKPDDEADARRILQTLSGRVHELWTGVCLWRVADGWQLQWQEVSRVQMRQLSAAEIDSYLRTRQWEGCSGAYAIQEENDPYLTVVEGSHSNVIGLPMESLARAFAELVSSSRKA
jgi:septum formation protein